MPKTAPRLDTSLSRRSTDSDAWRRRELFDAVGRLAIAEDVNPTEIEGFWAYRASAPTEPCVADYRLGLCIAVQGAKRVHFGDEQIDYCPMNGLLVALPLPLRAQVLEASPAKPCLAVVLEIDPALVVRTASALPDVPTPRAAPQAVRPLPITGRLLDSILRLAVASASERDADVFGDSLKHEVVFRLLETDQGELLRTLAFRTSSAHRVERVIRHLNRDIARPVTIADMARIAHMSESSFHRVFKEVTSMAPLQFLKRTRLQRARELLLSDESNAGEAARAVGYRSASQFSREFKAQFGVPPSRVGSV